MVKKIVLRYILLRIKTTFADFAIVETYMNDVSNANKIL